MRDVLKAMAEELRAGRRCALCAILQTQGSAPRKAGTLMLVRQDGSFAGTVGGGMQELKTLQTAPGLILTGENRTLYLSDSSSAENGVDPENGRSAAVGIYIAVPEQDSECAESAWTAAKAYAPGRLRLQMDEAGIPRNLDFDGKRDAADTIYSADGAKLIPGVKKDLPMSGAVLSVPVTRAGRCVLFGGGHVGAAVAKQLVMMGLETLVIDDRPALAVPERFPGAEVRCMPYTQADSLPLRRTDCVLVMTSGHESDFEVETAAIDAGVFYIGSLGSRKKAADLRKRLLGAGYTEQQVSLVHTPIGLDIGAETPAEIAISIAAELIAVRSGREGRKA